MRSVMIAAGIEMSIIASTASSAPAQQVDHRVDYSNTSGAGRSNDANRLFGSGGFNDRRSPYLPGVYSNDVITGSVSGLAGFRGFSPIPQNNVFRSSLPSAGLSDFDRRSVGLPDLVGNQAYMPSSYLEPARTISSFDFVRQGLNQPGSSTPLSPRVHPTNVPLNSGPIVPNPIDLRVTETPIGVTTGDIQGRILPNGAKASPYASPAVQTPYEQALTSSIFGPRVPNDVSPMPSYSPLNPRSTVPRATSIAPGIQPRVLATPEPSGRETANPDMTDFRSTATNPLESMRVQQYPVAQGGAAGEGSAAEPAAAPGWDAFADMKAAVNAARQTGQPVLAWGSPPRLAQPLQPRKESGSTGRAGEAAAPPGAAPNEKSIRQLATAVEWNGADLESPVRSFAGKSQNSLNRAMAEGESYMREGRFYDASRQFDWARSLDPTNPLPLLARGHALIAAGDYASGTLMLTRGIEQFPEILAFNLDLPSLAGGTDVFDRRRAELSRRLEIAEDDELRFLLGYLEYFSGLEERGLQDLDKAAQSAPEESVISRFADLLRGKQPLMRAEKDSKRGLPIPR